MVTWVLYLCIGVMIGGMAGFYFAKMDDLSKKQKKALEDKLKQSEQELLDYKEQVTGHFRETAALVNQMTESYQKVHEHLSAGANLLCNTEIDVNRIDVGPKLGTDNTPNLTREKSRDTIDQKKQKAVPTNGEPASDATNTETREASPQLEPTGNVPTINDTTNSDTTSNDAADTAAPEEEHAAAAIVDDNSSTIEQNNVSNSVSNDGINKTSTTPPVATKTRAKPVSPEVPALTDDIEAPKTSSISGENKSNNAASDNIPEADSAKGTPTSGNPNHTKMASNVVASEQTPDRQSPEKTAVNAAPNIYETMAVAEDFSEDAAQSDDLPKTPGSRMVH